MRILLVSTADWDHPFWTNKQYEARALAGQGHEVLYVEGLGLRAPSLAGGRDLGRIWRRLKNALRRPRRPEAQLTVVSPLVLPGWTSPVIRRINRVLFDLQMKGWRRIWGDWDVVWSFSPILPEIMDMERCPRPIVYHCVDDVSTQPSMPRSVVENAERALFANSSVVAVTAPALRARAEANCPAGCVIIEHFNAIDSSRFAHAEPTRRPADLPQGPVVGFVGALSRYKFDQDLVCHLANNRPEVNFILIGQEGEGSPGDRLIALHGLPNVHFLGPRARDQVPEYMSAFDVAIIPAPHNEYTQSMFPMKFFEYMAAGTPVVSTRLPALLPYSEGALLADGPDDFLAGVDAYLQGEAPTRATLRRIASAYTYEARTYALVGRVSDVVTQHGSGSRRAEGAKPLFQSAISWRGNAVERVRLWLGGDS